MSIYYPTGCGTVPPPICSDCPVKELGRVRSLFFQRNDFEFIDITDPAEWDQAICDQDVFVFPKTKGSLDMAEQMTSGFGDKDEDLMNYEFTLNIMEPNYPDNCDFWNSIKRANIYRVGWRGQTKVYLSDVIATIIPKAPIADDIKQATYWNIIVKFIQEDMPCAQDIATGVFDRCIACS